jgi:hypothetical protein
MLGCINDAANVKQFLCSSYGYKEGDIVMLTDDARNPRQVPTKENIVRGHVVLVAVLLTDMPRSQRCNGWLETHNRMILSSFTVSWLKALLLHSDVTSRQIPGMAVKYV